MSLVAKIVASKCRPHPPNSPSHQIQTQLPWVTNILIISNISLVFCNYISILSNVTLSVSCLEIQIVFICILFVQPLSFNKAPHGHCERNANDQNTTNQDQPYEAGFSGGA